MAGLDETGRALFVACRDGKIVEAERLLKKGANVNYVRMNQRD